MKGVLVEILLRWLLGRRAARLHDKVRRKADEEVMEDQTVQGGAGQGAEKD